MEVILEILRSSNSTTYYLLILENIFMKINILFKVNFRHSSKFYILKTHWPYGTVANLWTAMAVLLLKANKKVTMA